MQPLFQAQNQVCICAHRSASEFRGRLRTRWIGVIYSAAHHRIHPWQPHVRRGNESGISADLLYCRVSAREIGDIELVRDAIGMYDRVCMRLLIFGERIHSIEQDPDQGSVGLLPFSKTAITIDQFSTPGAHKKSFTALP